MEQPTVSTEVTCIKDSKITILRAKLNADGSLWVEVLYHDGRTFQTTKKAGDEDFTKLIKTFEQKDFSFVEDGNKLIIRLFGGFYNLLLEEQSASKQEIELKALRLEVAHLKVMLGNRSELQESILSLSSNGQNVIDGKLAWTHELVPINANAFEKSQDGTTITIKWSGVYRFDVKLLNRSGSLLFPFIAVNGAPIMYFYTSGTSYSDAVLNIVLSIKENSKVTIQFQNGHANLYEASTNPQYSCFSIQRLS